MTDDTTDRTAIEDDLDDRAEDDVVRVVVPPIEFDTWYAQTAPRLQAALTIVTGDHHAAADATAEAMARALERWRRVRTMDAPEAWTYRVAVNVWKRQQRRSTLGRSLLRRTVPRSEQNTTTALPVELRQLVDSLPHRQREVLVLRLVLGLSQAETATLTGLAEGTVASTLSDAKRSLRTALQDPEVTP
jgi:RNA polymerase sigma factor (sigma-70 family)